LTAELKDMTSAYQESEKRRKNAESALSEAQSRITEDTSRIQELTSQNDKMKVWFGLREGRGGREIEELRKGRNDIVSVLPVGRDFLHD
jgi:predicted  nucleic acid-binding Zn-ribbon protein